MVDGLMITFDCFLAYLGAELIIAVLVFTAVIVWILNSGDR